MQHILGLVRRCVEDYHMIDPGETVAVGVSGGKDSLLTLAALAQLRRFYPVPFNVHAITLETGTPGMSFDAVTDLCRDLEVPYTRISVPVYQIVFEERKEKNPCSLCAKLRRGSLNTALKDLGISKIALGHHFDDAVETMLMNLLFEGRIGCFQPVTYLDRSGITQIRPLLPRGRGAPGGGKAPAAGGAESLSRQRLHPAAGGEGAAPPVGGAVPQPAAEDLRRHAALSPVWVESGGDGEVSGGLKREDGLPRALCALAIIHYKKCLRAGRCGHRPLRTVTSSAVGRDDVVHHSLRKILPWGKGG